MTTVVYMPSRVVKVFSKAPLLLCLHRFRVIGAALGLAAARNRIHNCRDFLCYTSAT